MAHARQSQRRTARQFFACEWLLVATYLRLSPQQVSVRLALKKRLVISTESIYQYAYADKDPWGRLGVLPALPEGAQKALRQRIRTPWGAQQPGRH